MYKSIFDLYPLLNQNKYLGSKYALRNKLIRVSTAVEMI